MHNKSPKARRCAAGLTKTPFLFAPWLSRYNAKENSVKNKIIFLFAAFIVACNGHPVWKHLGHSALRAYSFDLSLLPLPVLTPATSSFIFFII